MGAQSKAIRVALRTALRAGVPTLGGRVWTNRAIPLADSSTDLPACVVLFLGEDPEDEYTPRQYRCKLEVALVLAARGTIADDVTDALDDLEDEALPIVFLDETIGGTCLDTIYKRTEEMELVPEGESLVIGRRIILEMEYIRDPYAERVIEPFERLHADWDFGPDPDDTLEAQDEVELEQ